MPEPVLVKISLSMKVKVVKLTVKFLNFLMPEKFAAIYLKFKQKGQTLGYLVKKMQME